MKLAMAITPEPRKNIRKCGWDKMVGWPDSEGLITIDLVEKRVPARRSVLNMEEAFEI
jgi:hypothetical protein